MKVCALTCLVVGLAVLAASGVRAEPFHGTETFDQEQAARIATVALAFMAPRILDPIPPSQLTVWGLRGLTTIDPLLSTQWEGHILRLTRRAGEGEGERIVTERATPGADDVAGWGALAAGVLRAGWDASRKVRRAGAGLVVESFFDELFNHLDPYSRYLSPLEADQDRADREGRAGVGFSVGARGARLVVREVMPGSPAAEAGVRPGDELLSIDGDSTEADDARLANGDLAGEEDTEVSVVLRHGGRARLLTLRRVLLVPQTVHATRDGALLVLRISSFAGDTGARLVRALAGRVGRTVRGIAIDLRGNRGGVLVQAVASARAFLAEGVVATTAGRDPEANYTFVADSGPDGAAAGSDVAPHLPVVVLVDGQSASAAEILAAALADQHRAVVVGSSTVGKGLVQTVTPLPDGGSLFVTWSRVLAPLGWPIQGLGVLPQVCTSFGQDAAERQLRLLATGVQPMQAALDRHRASRAPLPPAEALEIRQACPAAEGSDADLVAARFLIAHPAAYAAALIGPPGADDDPPGRGATLTRTSSARR
jgi:carboxyl-terminal processing protease